MKKLLIIPFILCCSFAFSQRLQYVNTYGYEYQRLLADSLIGLPRDTFRVPTAYRTFPFIAAKGTALYIWNTTTFVWGAVTAGVAGGNTSIGSALKIGVDGTNNLKDIAFSEGLVGDSLISGQVRGRLGQAIGQAGNPATMTTDREIPSVVGRYLRFKDNSTGYEALIGPGEFYTSGPLGGGLQMYIQPGAGTAFPLVTYRKGVVGSASTIVGTGVHWVGTSGGDKHYYIADMRDSIQFAAIESAGTSMAAFGTVWNGHVTNLGVKGPVVFGDGVGTFLNPVVPGYFYNYRSTYLNDSFMLAKRYVVTDSTGGDLLWRSRTAPYEVKQISVPDLATLIGGGSTPTLQQVLATEGNAAPIAANTVVSGTGSFFNWEFVNLGVFGVQASSGISLSRGANRNISLDASTGVRVTDPDSVKLWSGDNANPYIKLTTTDVILKNITSSIDTTTYKPLAGDPTTGNTRMMNSWAQVSGGGGSGLEVGVSTITSGTNTRVLYNNSGVLGEYTVTGTGTTAVLSTTPTFTTSLISPKIIGGTATTSDLDFQTTSGVGTTGADMHFRVGNNGATEAITIQNNASVGINNTSPQTKLDVAGVVNSRTDGAGTPSNPTFQFQDVNWRWFRDDDNSVGPQYSLITTGSAGGVGTQRSFLWRDNSTGNRFGGFVGNVSGSSGTENNFFITNTINQSGTAGYNGLLLNITETATGSGAKNLFKAQVGGTDKFIIDNAGNVGIGVTSPTAALHLKAGTTTASTAALKFTEGARTTTPEDGAIEKDDAFYGTKTNAVRYGFGGTLNSQYTDVGTVGTGEDDLMTYTIPAGTLSQDGDFIEFTMAFQFTGANNKTLKIKFGAVELTAYNSVVNGEYVFNGTITRKGAAVQIMSVSGVGSGVATYLDVIAPTETLSGTVVLKATGEATVNNEVLQRQMTVKFFPNN